MNSALHIFNAIWPYVAGGTAITVATQILKRAANLEKSAVIRTLFHTVTIVATGISWWLDHGVSATLLAVHGLGMSGIASAFYPAVKWVDGKLTKINQALKLVDKDLPVVENALNDAEQTVSAASGTSSTTTVSMTAMPAGTASVTSSTTATTPKANF